MNDTVTQFLLSAILCMSAADMSARIIGEQNNLTRAEAAKEVDRRRGELRQYLADNLSGESVRLVVPKGAAENAENIRAVVMAGGTNINHVSPSCTPAKPTRGRGRKAAGFSVPDTVGQRRPGSAGQLIVDPLIC